MRILAATDFSTRSQRALRQAGLLARERDADLTVVHVVDDDQPERLVDLERREAERYLAEHTAVLPEMQGVNCRPTAVTGEAFDGILRAADLVGADLIIMGSHRKQLLRDVFTGTTIERVIRTGSFPVLMVNDEAATSYRRVVAAVDMVPPAARAIRTADALGFFDGANLTAVHAFESTARRKMVYAGVETGQVDEHVADESRTIIPKLEAFLEANAIDIDRWTLRADEGRPIVVIADAVKETVADLVIVGTQGRNVIATAFLGSVAMDVLRSVETDILVVPPLR
ncbi:MAG TPA: universal stress protein [Gammaproteobacteria bacterium]|nr:universal stress protein [Gammaproteobacteria bacterium]